MNDKTIDHLVIVAGQRACGKSHFLDHEHAKLDFGQKGADLQFLSSAGTPHIPFLKFQKMENCAGPLFVVHIDLMNPVADQASDWKSTDDVISFFDRNPFKNWPELQYCISKARKVSFITIYAQIQVNFDRWIDRVLSLDTPQGRDSKSCDVRGVAILGKPELHCAFYKAWDNAIKAMDEVNHYWVDVTEKEARLLNEDQVSLILNPDPD